MRGRGSVPSVGRPRCLGGEDGRYDGVFLACTAARSATGRRPVRRDRPRVGIHLVHARSLPRWPDTEILGRTSNSRLTDIGMFQIVDGIGARDIPAKLVKVSAPPQLPELVVRALRMSLERGYVQASRTETGRLLATLAATRAGTIAECGTGCGVGAAWLRSGAPKTTRVITAELDPELAHGVMTMFAGDDIDVMHADWSSL